MFLKLLWSHLFWDAADKDVVVNNFLGVGAEQIVVEWQSSRRLAWSELEVAHLFAGKSKLVFLRDCHDGCVEGAVDVTADLRHARKDDASLLLEDGGEAGGGGFGFWEVVEVQVVLCSLGCIHYHGFVFFCVWI